MLQNMETRKLHLFTQMLITDCDEVIIEVFIHCRQSNLQHLSEKMQFSSFLIAMWCRRIS